MISMGFNAFNGDISWDYKMGISYGIFCGTNRGILQQYHGISPVIVDRMDM